MASSIRSFLFGKTLKIVEFPSGDIKVMTVRISSIQMLKHNIASLQPSPYPGIVIGPTDIKQIVRHQAPSFTIPIKTSADVHGIPDGSFIFWSQLEKPVIPSRGVSLDGKVSPTGVKAKDGLSEHDVVQAVRFADALRDSDEGDERISRKQHDLMVDLLIEGNAPLYRLIAAYRTKPEKFRYHFERFCARHESFKQD